MACRKFLLFAGVALSAGITASAQTVTPTPEAGITPSTIVLYRDDVLPGKDAAYQRTEQEIANAYVKAKIPAYWLALQSITSSSNVLYFDGFDSFAAVDETGATLAQSLEANPEIAALQQKLQENIASSRTVLGYRRDDMSFRLNRIDLSAARYVRVSIVEVRPGYEEEFIEAMRARVRLFETNDIDRPWMIYEVHSGLPLPTFIEFHPMDSLGEIDEILDRAKKGRHPALESRTVPTQKWMKETALSLSVEIYGVNLSISHLAPPAAATNLPAGERKGLANGFEARIVNRNIPIEKNPESNGLVSNQKKN